MTSNSGQASLISKLTLLVLVLILGCLAVLLYKAFEERPLPLEQTTSAELKISAPEPAAKTIASPPPASAPLPKAPSPQPKFTPRPQDPSRQPPMEAGGSVPAPPEVAGLPVPAASRHSLADAPTGLATAPFTIFRFEAVAGGGEMRLAGTASGKSWQCVSKVISGDFYAEDTWFLNPMAAERTKNTPFCEVTVPVRSLKSQAVVGASLMDQRMQTELKASTCPGIVFRLEELTLSTNAFKQAPGKAARETPVVFNASGELTIAGVTNKAAFPVTMTYPRKDALKFTGTYSTRMTAFGIKPPVFQLLGTTMTTSNEVNLSWTWLVEFRRTYGPQ